MLLCLSVVLERVGAQAAVRSGWGDLPRARRGSIPPRSAFSVKPLGSVTLLPNQRLKLAARVD